MDAPHQQQMVVLRLFDDLAYHIKSLRRRNISGGNTQKKNPDDNEEFAAKFSVIPEETQTYPPCFKFQFDGKDYPAMLMNIPTPVEALKSYDNKVFHKSGDIGQILQVFRNEQERDDMRENLVTEPYDLYYPHGLTAPTENIVRNRFDVTRINENFLTFRYQEVLADVLDFSTRSGGNLIPSTKLADTMKTKKASKVDENENDDIAADKLPYYETVIEEVLDYEEYMMDVMNPGHGRTIVFDGLQWTEEQIELVANHPEIIWSRQEEQDEVLEQQAQQMLRKKKHQILDGSSTDKSKGDDVVSTRVDNEVTLDSLSLKFKVYSSGTGLEFVDSEKDIIDGESHIANIEDDSALPAEQQQILPVVESIKEKTVDPSRAAAMLNMLLDGDGEDAEEGEGEEPELITEMEEIAPANVVEGDVVEGEEENDEADDNDWMNDL